MLPLLPFALTQNERRRRCATFYNTYPYRAVVALYASPKLPPIFQSGYLNALNREMRRLIQTLNAFDYTILPASTWPFANEAIVNAQPRIVLISGHSFYGMIFFEDDAGGVPTDPSHFGTVDTLSNTFLNVTKLEVVLLMTCDSYSMVKDREDENGSRVPNPLRDMTLENAVRPISILTWDGAVEDTAASDFVHGAVIAINEMLAGRDRNLDRLFDAEFIFKRACNYFLEQNHKLGVQGLPVLTTGGVDVPATQLFPAPQS